MLLASRLLARQRPRDNGILLHITSANFQTEVTVGRCGKPSMLEELWTIKRPKKKKNHQPTTLISAENSQGFKELRRKVIALKSHELERLAGHLERVEQQGLDSNNPANILGILPPPPPIPSATAPPLLPAPTKKVRSKKKKKTPEVAANQPAEENQSFTFNSSVISSGSAASFKVHSEQESVKELESPAESSTFCQAPSNVDAVSSMAAVAPAAGKKKSKAKLKIESEAEADRKQVPVVKKKIKPAKKKEDSAEVSPTSASSSSASAAVSAEESLANKIDQKLPILIAYFDVYVASGRLDEAYEDFKHLRANAEARIFVTHIQIYDLLLRGFARTHNFDAVQELWRDMVSRGLKPSLNSYISAMMSLSGEPHNKMVYRSMLRLLFKEFQTTGYTVADALTKGVFTFSDREQFLCSLDLLGAGLSSSALTDGLSTAYSCPLVAELSAAPTSALVSQIETVMTRQDLDSLVKSQLDHEQQRSVSIPSICREKTELTEKLASFTSSLEAGWRHKLAAVLTNRLNRKKKLPVWQKTQMINMHLFLSCVPVSTLVDIIISNAKEIIQKSETFSPPTSVLSFKLGNDVMVSYFLHCKNNLDPSYRRAFASSFSSYLDWYADPAGKERNHREAMERASASYPLDRDFVRWPAAVRMAVGTELKNLLLQELSLTRDHNGHVVVNEEVLTEEGQVLPPAGALSTCPAFFKVFRPRKENIEVEEVKPHPSLSQFYAANKMLMLQFSPLELPMLCPPLPWLSTRTGGYVLRFSTLIRAIEDQVSEQEDRIAALPAGGLNPVLDAVNQLGSVPWRVNPYVLKLAVEVFLNQSDKEMLSALSLPLHPDNIPPPVLDESVRAVLGSGCQLRPDQLQEYQRFQASNSQHHQIKGESYSLWCDALYRLSLASHFRENILWFPHNMDFRGRVYPIPPHLNHMGSDLAKSLLVFAKGKPLGREGFRWLKLHCINLTGLKKRDSIEARLKYADEIMDDILDSANRPVTGKRWYLQSDDPWQTYSACCEIRNALIHPGGPEAYICHLPIHQDGSCNGLQHYAAIGRDRLGAAAVNLVPAPFPQDVYSEIANIVERKRREDAEAGVEEAQVLEGFVKRKVVKQTVMTTVYGVTKYGATKQIARQLKDIDEFPAEHVDASSKYLSLKTFESLNEMFTASQEIQDWLTACAKVISGDCDSNVEWQTPLGLPVVQPYTRLVGRSVPSLSMEDRRLLTLGRRFRAKDQIRKVNTLKHKNGFPPNFIHSLDSTHMMLTSLHLWAQGITFASVHDCYWTHACDVETMNRACREQFIALHSSPILENLSEFFLQKFTQKSGQDHATQQLVATQQLLAPRDKSAGVAASYSPGSIEAKKRELLFRQVPAKGSLDLNVVRDSVYFFS